MAARGGIFRRLRDKSLSWDDRLKLLRYVWKNDSVFILNKQQVLLDWFCLALAGKHRVEPQEAAHVWQCFHDVLRTKKCQQSTRQGQPIILKSSIFQAIVDELSAVMSNKSRNSHSDDVIISCCLCLMTSPNLANTVTCKFDFMLQLLACITDVCLKEMMSHRTPSDNMVQLLEVALEKYRIAHRQKVVLQQMVQQSAQKLLRPVLLLAHSIQEHQGAALNDVTDRLVQTLLKALFPKELMPKFELYLKLMTNKTATSESSPPKYIQCIFTILEETLKQPDKEEAVLIFIPTFYKSFLTQYKGAETTLGFQLLQHLSSIIGVGSLDPDPSMDVDQDVSMYGGNSCTATQTRLAALGDLLKAVSEAGVYEVTGSEGSAHTTWFCRLTAWLVTLPSRSVSWFSCVRGLLQLSYVLVEPQLVSLLDSALWPQFLQVRDCPSVEAADGLLCELLSVYERLRQQTKFFKKLLLAFRGDTQHKDIPWPPNFTRLMCVCMTTLPTATLMEIWQSLTQEVTSHYLPMLSEGITQEVISHDLPIMLSEGTLSTEDCSAICQLFSHLLLNAKVVDYSVTQQMATRLQHCMVETKDNVLRPLLTAMVNERDSSPRILALVHSWGELQILLGHYADRASLPSPAFQPISAAMAHHDLTFVHPYLESAIWRNIFSLVDKIGDVRSKFLLQKLMIQKVRAIVLFHGESEANDVTTSIQNVVGHLVANIPAKNDEDIATCWDGEISTVDNSTHRVALWQLLCEHSTLVVLSCTAVQLDAFVEHLLWTISSLPSRSCSVSLESITMAFLGSPEFQECRQLQSVFVTTLWRLVACRTGCKKSSPHKKARKDLSSVRELVSQLGSSAICWQSVQLSDLTADNTSETTASQILDKVCSGVGALMTQGKKSLGKVDKENSLLHCLKLLKSLPLQYLAVADEIRCILGLLLVTLNSVQLQSGSDQSELVVTCIDMLTLVLEGAKHTSFIFQRINIGRVISVFIDIQKSQTRSNRRQFDPLLKVMLKLATRDEMSASDLDGFITLLRHKMAALRVSEGVVDSDSTVSAVVITLQFLARVLQRKNMQDSVRTKLEEYHAALTTDFLQYANDTLKTAADSDVVPYLLTGVAGVVEHLSHGDGESDVLETVGAIVTSLSQRCRTLCDSSNNASGIQPDRDTIASCVTFVRVIAKCHEITRDFVPDGFLHNCWTTLVTLLRETHNGDDVMSMGREASSDVTRDGLSTEMQGEIKETLAVIIGTLSFSEFSQIVYNLVDRLDVSSLTTDQTELTISLDIWQQLLRLQLDEESAQFLVQVSPNVILRIEGVLLGCQDHTEISPTVVVSALNTLTKMLSEGRALLSPQSVMLCLHCCQVAPLTDEYTRTSSAAFEALYQVLNEMLLQHPFVVFGCIPAYISAAKRLLKVAMHTGQQRTSQRNENYTNIGVTYCRLVDRLFTLMSTHKVEFAKVAGYLVADYVGELQKITLLPPVKKSLLPAIHKLLDMCDQHTVALLHAVLTAGTREVFRSLYSDYTKFYKYMGRV